MRQSILLLTLFAAACGGGSGSSTVDAPPIINCDPADPAACPAGQTCNAATMLCETEVPQACNPVVNTGCAPMEKCTWVVIREDDPATNNQDEYLGILGCRPLPANPVPENGVCQNYIGGAPSQDTGYSDCDAGLDCLRKDNSAEGEGVCEKLCQASTDDGCTAGMQSCSTYNNFYEFDGSDIGLCNDFCDANLQDCPAGDGACYYSIADDQSNCIRVPQDTIDQNLGQDKPCLHPVTDPTACFLNGCIGGTGPFLYPAVTGRDMFELAGSPNQRTHCATFCKPGVGMKYGDTSGGEQSCQGVGNGDHQCQFYNSVFNWSDAADISPNFGICVPARDPVQAGTTGHASGAPYAYADCSLITIAAPVMGQPSPNPGAAVSGGTIPMTVDPAEDMTAFEARQGGEFELQRGCLPFGDANAWWMDAATPAQKALNNPNIPSVSYKKVTEGLVQEQI